MSCWCDYLPTFFVVVNGHEFFFFFFVILASQSNFPSAVFVSKNLQSPHPSTAGRWRAPFQPEVISTCCERAPAKEEEGLFWCRRSEYKSWVPFSQTMCSVVVPTTDMIPTAESQTGNSDREEESKATKRKISLSTWVFWRAFNYVESC